jgi:hypothetical protein
MSVKAQIRPEGHRMAGFFFGLNNCSFQNFESDRIDPEGSFCLAAFL